MRQFDRIRRRDRTRNAGSQSQDEAPTGELAHGVCRSLDRSANQHDDAAHEDGEATAPVVSEEAAERTRSDLAEIVGDEDDAGGGTRAFQSEGLLVGVHGVDGAHEGRIEAIEG